MRWALSRAPGTKADSGPAGVPQKCQAPRPAQRRGRAETDITRRPQTQGPRQVGHPGQLPGGRGP